MSFVGTARATRGRAILVSWLSFACPTASLTYCLAVVRTCDNEPSDEQEPEQARGNQKDGEAQGDPNAERTGKQVERLQRRIPEPPFELRQEPKGERLRRQLLLGLSAAHRARWTLAPTALANARKFTRRSEPHDCLVLDATKGMEMRRVWRDPFSWPLLDPLFNPSLRPERKRITSR